MNRVTRLYGAAVLVVLIGIAYMSFTQPVATERPEAQAQLYADVPAAKPPAPPKPPVATGVETGEALLYMSIPRFGHDWTWVAVEGTELAQLDLGPGHFTGTPLPGEPGNTAFAAHRATHGDPFIDFDELRAGDQVVLAQSGAEWTYRVTGSPIRIEPSEDWILDDLPDTQTLTLVTCWPKYGSDKRLYVRAELVDWTPRS